MDPVNPGDTFDAGQSDIKECALQEWSNLLGGMVRKGRVGGSLSWCGMVQEVRRTGRRGVGSEYIYSGCCKVRVAWISESSYITLRSWLPYNISAPICPGPRLQGPTLQPYRVPHLPLLMNTAKKASLTEFQR